MKTAASTVVHSALYEGHVHHVRHVGVEHQFTVPLTLFYLDLNELPAVQALSPTFRRGRWGFLAFNEADYLAEVNHSHAGAEADLATKAKALVQQKLGWVPDGPIRILTQPRYCGFVFNPVSFLYCFDTHENLQAVIAEITNTPWRQRHTYVIDCRTQKSQRVAKTFHVSPFQPMQQEYDWRFADPGHHLDVHMHNHAQQKIAFTANMRLCRRPLTAHSLAGVVVRRPMQTAQVMVRIYCEAARLWWKGAPFHPHPDTTIPHRKESLVA